MALWDLILDPYNRSTESTLRSVHIVSFASTLQARGEQDELLLELQLDYSPWFSSAGINVSGSSSHAWASQWKNNRVAALIVPSGCGADVGSSHPVRGGRV